MTTTRYTHATTLHKGSDHQEALLPGFPVLDSNTVEHSHGARVDGHGGLTMVTPGRRDDMPSLVGAEASCQGIQQCIGHSFCIIHVSSGTDRGSEPFPTLRPRPIGYIDVPGNLFCALHALSPPARRTGHCFVQYTRPPG